MTGKLSSGSLCFSSYYRKLYLLNKVGRVVRHHLVHLSLSQKGAGTFKGIGGLGLTLVILTVSQGPFYHIYLYIRLLQGIPLGRKP